MTPSNGDDDREPLAHLIERLHQNADASMRRALAGRTGSDRLNQYVDELERRYQPRRRLYLVPPPDDNYQPAA